jgi:hypothetical protein
MNSGEIRKMQQQQIAKLDEIRKICSSSANNDTTSALVLVAMNEAFWLSEIALQLARHNELAEVSHGIRPVNTLQDPQARSLWERVFGHKANEL